MTDTSKYVNNKSTGDVESQKDLVRQNLDFTSDRISDLSRYIGFGLAAIAFALLTSSSKFAIVFVEDFKFFLLGVAACGCLTILLDYMQYAFGFLSARQAKKNVEGQYKFKPRSLFWQLRYWLFWVKQVPALIGSAVLIFAIASSIE